MQSTKSDILRLAESDFIKWLRAGLVQIPRPSSIPPDKTDVLVQIPAKYGRLVDKSQTFVALIDEIVGVTKLTPDLTREFGARLRNLGEAWLPISHHPEWLLDPAKATSTPVGPDDEQVVPGVEGYCEAAAGDQESTLDLPGDVGQDRCRSSGPEGEDAREAPPPASEEQPIAAQTSDAIFPFVSSDSPPVQASGRRSPRTAAQEEEHLDGLSAPKDRKRLSISKKDKKGTTANRAKQPQSSLLSGSNGDMSDQQSEDVHD